MFDFGLSELMIVGVVALVVVGPERLPRLARQVGEWMGKLQRYVADVKSDLNRQVELDELRRMQQEVKDAAQSIESSVNAAVSETTTELNSIGAAFEGGFTDDVPATDWNKVYAVRRQRDRIKERRREREKELGIKRPKRPFHR